MMSGNYNGRRAVHYEIAAEPVFSGQCQCRDFQRATGSGHANAMAFPKSAARKTNPVQSGQSFNPAA
jgi:hypothetical protein